MDEMLVCRGGTIKALGDGRLGGYLVTFSSEQDPDLVGDFFTPTTDFGVDWETENGKKTAPVYFNHGLDETIGKRRLGTATLKMDDTGIWVEWEMQQAKAASEYRGAL